MDPGDLEHNRRGTLGPGQRARIEALMASYGPVRFAFGAAADAGRALVKQLRQSLDDGRVVAATGEVGMDLAAFRAGVAERRVFDLPGNFASAYVAALDGGGRAVLASWLNLLPGRYAIYRATPVGLVVGVEPLPTPDHALRFFRLLCAAQGLTAETLTENRRGRATPAQRIALALADETVEAPSPTAPSSTPSWSPALSTAPTSRRDPVDCSPSSSRHRKNARRGDAIG